ncbi:uncharacterized protein TNCV_4662311 [Trichonephila clavipes]|uniref:Uncharacterized protein n=1 Tax=Trichonephila clavipes TaxID=2585209 RepID=A0A8X6SCV1_TRICX|nr:uncharacterized protein TNCV_4662311 [Trichonephila clavipes]
MTTVQIPVQNQLKKESYHSEKTEGRFVLGTFRSERMRVLNRSRQNDSLRVMLVLVHTDIAPPHTPLPVFRRIDERTIPYSWRAYYGQGHQCRKEGSFWVPSVPNECEYFTDHAKDDRLRVMLVLVHINITPPQRNICYLCLSRGHILHTCQKSKVCGKKKDVTQN